MRYLPSFCNFFNDFVAVILLQNQNVLHVFKLNAAAISLYTQNKYFSQMKTDNDIQTAARIVKSRTTLGKKKTVLLFAPKTFFCQINIRG